MLNPYDIRFGAEALSARSSLLAKVAALLAFSMAFTALGAIVGVAAPELGLPAMIGVLILSFALGFARNVGGLNLILLYLLTALAGVGLGGVIEAYIATGAGSVVVEAGGTTALLTLVISIYAWTTKHDFSSIGGKLFVALLGLIAASIVSIFIQATLLDLLIGIAGSIIFSLYLIAQIQQVRNTEDTLPNAIILAVGIYLSVLNLFYSLLRIFSIVGGRRD